MIPVLLYGAENWIMTEQLVKRVDSFLGEMAKRAVKWPKHHSNTAALVALEHGVSKSPAAGDEAGLPEKKNDG